MSCDGADVEVVRKSGAKQTRPERRRAVYPHRWPAGDGNEEAHEAAGGHQGGHRENADGKGQRERGGRDWEIASASAPTL